MKTDKIKDRNYLFNMYNATSTVDENDRLETYESWLERQLLSRLEPKTYDEETVIRFVEWVIEEEFTVIENLTSTELFQQFKTENNL